MVLFKTFLFYKTIYNSWRIYFDLWSNINITVDPWFNFFIMLLNWIFFRNCNLYLLLLYFKLLSNYFLNKWLRKLHCTSICAIRAGQLIHLKMSLTKLSDKICLFFFSNSECTLLITPLVSLTIYTSTVCFSDLIYFSGDISLTLYERITRGNYSWYFCQQ